jgi:CheY-like chemotaxis protein/anti-sigma regulatory factor (Ser/Thr protein kinase)
MIRRSRDQVRAANADLAVTNSALSKALAAKTEFLATTSHEIRTPLNGILGMTQVMLTDRSLAPATRDRLTVVHGAGMTMRALVDDILDVAKMETGNLGLEVAPFDLRTMLEEASRMWAEQASAKGLTFKIELDQCPGRVEGDVARVRQIVFNLLSNACKFTSQGSVTLSAEAGDTGVLIRVADTGIGIAPEQHQAVFESFRQADASTTRQFGGTGLGLSICRNLARAMDGEVTLASKPGEGSTFTVALPLPAATSAPVCAAPSEGGAILVIDRNPIVRAMMRTLLTPHAAKVVFAGTAAEAAECLAAGGIARVLIDDATARADADPRGFVAQVVASADGALLALLWPKGEELEGTALLELGIGLLIPKPITGAALVQQLFPTEPAAEQQSSLVPRAA